MSLGRAARARLKRGLLAAAALGALGVLAWQRTRPLGVETWTVDRGPVVREAFGTGLLESVEQVELAFELPGRITQLTVDEGDVVRAGQVLAEVDATELEAQLGVADANRSLASLSTARARADLERAKALRERAREDLERAERLAQAGVIPPAERDALGTRLATVEADVRAALATRAQLGQGVTVASRSREVTASLAQRSKLRSPIDGFVVRRARSVGDYAQVGQWVFRVAEERLKVRAWLDESVLAELATEQTARVVLRSEPERAYQGRVTRIAREADPQTHEVLVDVELTEVPQRFAIGQRADVYVQTAARDQVVRLPLEACRLAEQRCLVQREGRAALASFEPGLIGSSFFEVKQGLLPGEQIIVSTRDGREIAPGRRVQAPGQP